MTDSVMSLLSDEKHWAGWLLTAGVIWLVFGYLMKSYSELTNFILFGSLLFIIMAVDIFKHRVGLQ